MLLKKNQSTKKLMIVAYANAKSKEFLHDGIKNYTQQMRKGNNARFLLFTGIIMINAGIYNRQNFK